MCLLLPALAHARTTQNWDFNWKFHLGDTAQAAQPDFSDSGWRLLDVPHDWSAEGAYNKDNPGGGASAYLPTGIGWYRKTFTVPPAMLDQSVWIVFDGVFMDSTVWINGYKLGTRPYGYESFFYALSGHLRAGKNVISVRVDNQLQPAARWYTGSGIYGHVHLIFANPTHIAQWSTFVRTLRMDDGDATVAVSTQLEGCAAAKNGVILEYSIVSPRGETVASRSVPACQLAAGEEPALDLTVSHADLWSPDTPALYTLRTRVTSGGDLLDATETVFGIRTESFTPDRGFFLNGQPLKLKGVADHLYGGPMGTAIPDSILVRRLRLLKEMGVNAIRTAHNPHPPIFYDLCDQMGIMVMDEFVDGWQRKAENDYGARFFKEWWRRDVADWVKRDRNHPSVILWSIGNETGFSDRFGMSAWIHKFDPTRPTTGGRVHFGVDVAGFNGESEVPGLLAQFHKEHPTVPILLTEAPHTYLTRGFYRVRNWWRDWKHVHEFPEYGSNQIFFDGKQWFRSSYDNAVVRISARGAWQQVATTPWISGAFRWTGFDYLGEADYKGGRWPDRAKSGVGVLDMASIPKDAYYLYQSLWTAKPMVHVLPDWTHRGMKGVVIPVVAYSNQPEVELFLNGKSLGRHKPEPLGDFVWKVPYEAGTLKAVAYAQDGKEAASDTEVTAGEPVKLALETDNSSLRPNRTDTAIVTAEAVDNKNTMVPWDANWVSFKVTGPVHLLGYENGDPTDVTSNQAPRRRLFYGMERGFFESTARPGPIEVTAAAILGEESMGFESEAPRTIAIAVSRVALRGALPPADLEVRYTTDGSEPNASSTLYSHPFAIRQSTVVRALILRDHKPFMTACTHFWRVDPTMVSDPRWATDSQVDPGSRRQ